MPPWGREHKPFRPKHRPTQQLQHDRSIRHEPRRLLDRVAQLILLSELALIGSHASRHPRMARSLRTPRLSPGGRKRRVLVEKIASSGHLLSGTGGSTTARCRLPAACSRATTSGSRLGLFRFCRFENGVHMGLPTKSSGRWASRSFDRPCDALPQCRNSMGCPLHPSDVRSKGYPRDAPEARVPARRIA